MTSIKRREFAQMVGGCAALTNTSLLSTIFSLSATNSAMAAAGDLSGYKALVCLFLFGGNDSFNTLTPLDPTERVGYLSARGGVHHTDDNPAGLGLPESSLQEIIDAPSGRRFGVHPSMPEVKQLYDSGKLTFVCNVGSLIEPTTMEDYNARSNLPLGLFSHADLQRHWMTSVPQTRSQVTGWAGRMADMVNGPTNPNTPISMNISLNSVNMLQTGGSIVPYVVGTDGAKEVSNYFQPWTKPEILKTMNEDALARAQNNLLEKTFASMNINSINAAVEFNQAAMSDATKNAIDGYFPASGASSLQQQLRMVARTIHVQNDLGQQRQIFFVSHNGYDNHDGLFNGNSSDPTLGPHGYNMMDVSQALSNFQAAMDGTGKTDNVLLFTASDFARTLNSNGRGSDHAWGGNQIVMGGAVNDTAGNRIYGEYPMDLSPGNPLDLGRGRLLPTTSVDQFACELAMWYGVSNDNNMEMILPNIRNFHNLNNNNYPIGFVT